jgi:HlyD family secretion protein
MKNISPIAENTVIPREVLRIALATAFAGAGLGLGACERRSDRDDAPLVLSGNVEVVDAQIGFKASGRVAERLVSEGQVISRGQLVARLDDVEQQQQLALRRAELAAAEAFLRELQSGSRPQEIAAAEAAVRSAQAEEERLRLDFARAQELRAKEVIAPRDFELSQAQLRVAEARRLESQERLKLVQEGPRIETLEQAKARVEQARAAVALAETQVENTRVSSPLDGIVVSHHVEAGEFVSPGTPVVSIADLSRPWVRAYVDQTELGKLRHGQMVQVRIDTYPDKTYDGVVAFISSEAEFTPKTVQTTKERTKLVYRVKVDVANVSGDLKPGMPADVVFN